MVIFWATFALLCSPETMSHSPEDGGAAIEAGTAICAITVAHLIRVASGRHQPLLRWVFKFAPVYLGSLNTSRPVAHKMPPLTPPSLERLQILRT